MIWQWTPFTIFITGVALFFFGSAGFFWRRFRHKPAARVGVVLAFAVGWWMMGSVLELFSIDPTMRVFWDKFQFIAIVVLPPGWIIYALFYVGRAVKLTHRQLFLLLVIPALTLLLVYTNGWHHLVWAKYELTLVDGVLIKSAEYGPAFWLFMVYAYTAVFAGLVILLQAVVESGRLYRWQGVGLIIAAMAPWLVNFASIIFSWKPFRGMDLTPFALGIMVSIVGWTIYRLQLQDIGPAARHMMFDQMGDGVLVLDANHYIMDVNPALLSLLGQSESHLLGRPVTRFWPDWPRELLTTDQEGGMQIEWTLNGLSPRIFDMRVSPLRDGRRRLMSWVVVLRDIGERKQMEEQLKASLQEKEALLKEIHHRVKNNLQIISSLLNLQSDVVVDVQSRDVLRDSQHRVRSMALIHEKLYQSSNLARIDFGDYVEKLATYLVQAYRAQAHGVRLQVDVKPVYLDVDTAVPCGLILNELIANALKHGFVNGRSGQIHISLHPTDDQIILEIADDGVGIPPEINIRQSRSLGLQLVNTLVNQINGQITLNRENGTAFILTLAAISPQKRGY